MIQEFAMIMPVTISCGLLGFAVCTDMRAHRIPNWLVMGLLLVGFTHQLLVSGPAGLLSGIGGVVVGMG